MNHLHKISIQSQDFSIGDEVKALEEHNLTDGAVVTFSGRVRNHNNGDDVQGLYIEHYPQMTEKSLTAIAKEAQQRWQINRVTIIHRIGQLAIGEQIVFVGVTSPHRVDAFQAAEFIMDFLKVKAPFWKKEMTANGNKWLDSKQSDVEKSNHWLNND